MACAQNFLLGHHMTCGQERKCCWTGDLCLVSPLFWSWFFRSLFSEQLDDLGGRTLRSNNYTLTLLAYIISSGQPRSTTHPSHTKLLTDEMEGGSRRLWKPWQRVWTSGKDMCNLFNLVNHGLGVACMFYHQLAQAGHSTSSKWRTVGGKHQWIFQRPGGFCGIIFVIINSTSGLKS